MFSEIKKNFKKIKKILLDNKFLNKKYFKLLFK